MFKHLILWILFYQNNYSFQSFSVHSRNHEQQKESKPTFTRPLPQQSQHRRSLSTGNLNLNKSSEMHQNISHHLSKNNTLQKFNNSEKLNNGLSVSMEKLNPRRSMSAENINSDRLGFSERLCHSRTNSEKSSGTLSKPSGVSKIRSNLVPSANRLVYSVAEYFLRKYCFVTSQWANNAVS